VCTYTLVHYAFQTMDLSKCPKCSKLLERSQQGMEIYLLRLINKANKTTFILRTRFYSPNISNLGGRSAHAISNDIKFVEIGHF